MLIGALITVQYNMIPALGDIILHKSAKMTGAKRVPVNRRCGPGVIRRALNRRRLAVDRHFGRRGVRLLGLITDDLEGTRGPPNQSTACKRSTGIALGFSAVPAKRQSSQVVLQARQIT